MRVNGLTARPIIAWNRAIERHEEREIERGDAYVALQDRYDR